MRIFLSSRAPARVRPAKVRIPLRIVLWDFVFMVYDRDAQVLVYKCILVSRLWLWYFSFCIDGDDTLEGMLAHVAHTKRRLAIVLLIAALVVIVTAVAYKMAVMLVYGRPLADPNVGFTYVEPRYLPPPYHITGRRINVMRGQTGRDMHRLLSAQASLNLSTRDWIYGITERRAAGEQILTPLTNYDPESVQPTCINHTSPGGRLYRLCHWVDWGTVSVFEVQWVQGGTFIWATFPAQLHTKLLVQETGQFVDSFVPASSAGIPIVNGP